MKSMKDYLTTGQVAKLMSLSQRFVCCLCDSGKLPCVKVPRVKVPGNGHDRRIHQADLAEFCTRHGYTRVLSALDRVLLPAVVSYTSSLQWAKRLAAELEGRLSVTMALSSYELGWECCRQRPLAVVLDTHTHVFAEAVRHLRFLLPRPLLIGLVPDDLQLSKSDQALLDFCGLQSCNPALIADAIIQRLAVTNVPANGATHGT